MYPVKSVSFFAKCIKTLHVFCSKVIFLLFHSVDIDRKYVLYHVVLSVKYLPCVVWGEKIRAIITSFMLNRCFQWRPVAVTGGHREFATKDSVGRGGANRDCGTVKAVFSSVLCRRASWSNFMWLSSCFRDKGRAPKLIRIELVPPVPGPALSWISRPGPGSCCLAYSSLAFVGTHRGCVCSLPSGRGVGGRENAKIHLTCK